MRRISWVLRSVLATGALALTALPVFAATAADLEQCSDMSDLPRVITACSAILADERIPKDMHAPILLNRGMAFLATDKIDPAIVDFEAAAKLNPKDINAVHELAIAYSMKGDFKRAIDLSTKAAELDPTMADTFHNRANYHKRLGNMTSAIADYTKAIELSPNTNATLHKDGKVENIASDRVRSDYFGGRGVTHFFAGNEAAAVADLTRAAELGPDYAYHHIWRYLAAARAAKADAAQLQAATAALKAASAGFKSDAWPSPVMELLAGGRTPEAALAAATTPGSKCEATFYAGEWHALRGDKAAAMAAFKAAVDNCPKTEAELDAAVFELKRLAQ
jgi:tetratricopeptide (TPR) repeat protein